MYEYISGKLVEVTPAYAVVDCGGMGYMIEISLNTYTQIKDLQEVKLLLHYVVREDAHLLVGFYESAEREMFRRLISVSGVGLVSARVLLSTFTVNELKEAVLSNNVKTIQSAKGIGAKTAQRLIIELQDKVGKVSETMLNALSQSNKNIEEALSALVMLGFPRAAADKALQAVSKKQSGLTVEELIKQALQTL